MSEKGLFVNPRSWHTVHLFRKVGAHSGGPGGLDCPGRDRRVNLGRM